MLTPDPAARLSLPESRWTPKRKVAPQLAPLTSVDVNMRKSTQASFRPLNAEDGKIPSSALLFDALGLEAGGAALPVGSQPLLLISLS